MLKNMKQKFREYIQTRSMLAQKVSKRKDIFYGIDKKEKTLSRVKSFWSIEICLLTQFIKNIFFSRNFVCGHNIFRCTPEILVFFFLHFKMQLLHSGNIYSHESK